MIPVSSLDSILTNFFMIFMGGLTNVILIQYNHKNTSVIRSQFIPSNRNQEC